MVKVNVKLSAMFRDIVKVNNVSIDLTGETVKDLVTAMINELGPQLGERILDATTGELRRFVNIFVNGKDIRNLGGPNTKLNEGDEVRLIPAIAGGKDFMGLTQDQIVRYSRQIILKEVGGKGQKKLMSSKVLVVGAGGLGSPASLYLAAAGIGKLGIVDGDKVDLSNLQRQILHGSRAIGKSKVKSARDTISGLNPEVEVIIYDERLCAENVFDMLNGWDFVIDGSDNFPTKFLINDACVIEKVPFSHAGVLRFVGMTTTIIPHKGPCYRCFVPESPPPGMVPSCQEAGVLGTITGIVGSIQANEAMKFLLDLNGLLVGKILFFDGQSMKFDEFEVKRNHSCSSCGENPLIKDLTQVDYGHVCEVRS